MPFGYLFRVVMSRDRIIDLIFAPISEPIILFYPFVALAGVPFAVVGWTLDLPWAIVTAFILFAPVGLVFPLRLILSVVLSGFDNPQDKDT